MPVIIDGNNLLYAARGARDDGSLMGRRGLCDTLARWARRRGERVHVVFDGPPPAPGLARQIANPAIQVSYSGGNTADAEVMKILAEDSAARRLLVVSSDREIVRAAARRRASTIRSDEFWALVEQDLSRPVPVRSEPREKKQGLSPGATEQWLREFGFDSAEPNSSESGAV